MSFKPMLAKAPKLDASGEPAITYPVVAQPKLDGIRAAVVNGKLVSRTLKPIPNREIRDYLERPEFEGFDGELIVGDPTAEDCYRRSCSFVMAQDKTGEPWAFHAFDLWNTAMPFYERDAFLAQRMMVSRMSPVKIRQSDSRTVSDADELRAYEARVVGQGHEGVILRDPKAAYKFGRSGSKGPLLKLKRFSDSEAVILGTVEEMHNTNEAKTNALGRTERSSHAAGKIGKGTLGKLLVRDRYSGVEFSVGTGFTAAERADLWSRREALVGQVIRYKFFPIGVKDRPRHPVMEGFRYEADLPSLAQDRGGEG